MSTILTTTAAKVVLRQNDIDSAKRFSELVGKKTTIKKKKVKGPDGKEKEEEEKKEEEMLSPMDIMKLGFNDGVLIFQGFYDRPIKTKLKMTFQDKEYSSYRAMGRSAPMPEFLVPSHHAILEYAGTPKFYDPQTKELKELTPVAKQ